MLRAGLKQPLAVVGMACRFPGGLNDLPSFWQGLVDKRNAIGDIPADRWNINRFYADDDQASGKMYMRKGGFIDQDFRTFDASFFGISPREASYMDPQQRLLLEVTWEALENAGIDPVQYDGHDVGVYVGGFTLDHLLNQLGSGSRENIGPHSAVGSTMTILSARISHAFNFVGPAISVDTACSSSLVAFHYACQDLWANRCEMAVVGGANVMFRPEYPIAMCKGKFLARDGHSKSFDARGDGYARGEGCGVLLVKRLRDAEAAGDPVWALVEATGVNQDGRTNGITVPSGAAQQALMQRVLAEAGILSQQVRYVEAHGTGTSVGDPIEASAIGAVYGAQRNDTGCIIGSVKSNIGHLEAGAGVAGLIKLVLSLRHNTAPALANLIEPHPGIPFADLGIRLADRLMPIAENATGDIYGAINSFGYGGTNAHAILRRVPPREVAELSASAAADERETPHILPVSARSKEAMVALARCYRDRLVNDTDPLEDFAYSAARHRTHTSHRAAIIGATREDIARGLSSLILGNQDASVCTGVQSYAGARRPVFVYTGMGPQWWGMGQQLWREDPVFRATVSEADRVFESLSGFSVLAEMLKDEKSSRITETQLAQPANFMVQIGITAMLRAAGVTPGAIVGHSVGEVSSSYVAGALSLKDALTVSFHRSRVQKKAAGTGAMLAAALTQADAEDMLVGRGGQVSIGAINGPRTITFAGDKQMLDEMAADLDGRGVFNRALRVEVPYHSPMMEPLKEELASCLAHLKPKIPTLPLYSTVTGDRVEVIAYDAEYWTHNIRQPVYFADAIRNLLADDFTTFIEIGPHPVLSTALKECFAAARVEAVAVETLRRSEQERPRIIRTVAQTYASGCDIDWSCQYPSGRFLHLPHYPWQRELLWNEGSGCTLDRTSVPLGPLLGLRKSAVARKWEKDLSTESLRYLTDHVVDGLPILPAAAFIEALLEIARAEAGPDGGYTIRNLKLRKALPIDRSVAQRVACVFSPETKVASLASLDANQPTDSMLHATAELYPLVACPDEALNLEALALGMTDAAAPEVLYARFAERGLNYGPFFQTIRRLRVSPEGTRMLVDLELAQDFDVSEGKYLANPTLLDGCFQALIALLAKEGSNTPYLPTAIRELRLHRAFPQSIVCHGVLTKRTPRELTCDLQMYDQSGALLAVIKDARFTALRIADAEALVPSGAYRYVWTQAEQAGEATRLGRWLVVGSSSLFPVAACIAALQAEKVESVAVLQPGASSEALPEHLAGVVFFVGPTASQDEDATGEGSVIALTSLLQALMRREEPVRPRVYVVTQAAFKVTDSDTGVFAGQGSVVGLARVACSELDGLRCTALDIPALVDEAVIRAVGRELLIDSASDEVAFRREGRFVSELLNSTLLREQRLAALDLASSPSFAVWPAAADRSAVFHELPREPVAANAIRIALHTAVLPGAAFGHDSLEDAGRPQWMEIQGVVADAGDGVIDLAPGARVCGYAPVAFVSHVEGDRSRFHLTTLPDDPAEGELLSVAMLLATAQVLADVASIGPGDRVLVWGTPVGLALASVAIRRNAEVALLVPPTLDEAELGSLSALPRFAASVNGIDAAVADGSAGRGFSVVAAPLTLWNQAFDFAALAAGGRVIDLDEIARPAVMDPRIGMLCRRDPEVLLHHQSSRLLAAIAAAVESGVAREADIPALEPAYLHVADLPEIEAVILAAQERLALHFADDGRTLQAISADWPLIRGDATYVITGGLGGLGQEVARWLASRGARHLLLLSRSGVNDPEKRAFVAELEARDVTVRAPCCDVASPQAVAALFADLTETMPPLKGVFHSAAVVDDAPLMELTPDRIARVMATKAGGGWTLHKLTEDLDLDHFVLFSSISPLVGNSRQANYAAANAFLDALAWHRRLRGLPASSINWGAIADAGMVARDERVAQHLRSIGLTPLPVAAALAGMDRVLARGVTQVCVAEKADWAQWANSEPLGGESPRFRTLVAEARGQQDQSSLVRLQSRLSDIDPGEREEMLAMLLASIYASELRLPEEALDIDRPVVSYGVDSLLGLNIQMGIDVHLGLRISTLELIGNNTLRQLAGKCLRDIGLNGDLARVAAE